MGGRVSAYQKLPVINAHPVHILYRVDICGLSSSRSGDYAVCHDRTTTLTRSVRLNGGPVRDIFSTSCMLRVRSLGTDIPVDSLSSARLLEKLAVSFANGEGILEGVKG